jgi:hypothetical protein
LTPAIIGQAVVDLHENPSRWDKLAYRVSGDGLVPLEQIGNAQVAVANTSSRGRTAAAKLRPDEVVALERSTIQSL